MKMYKYFSRIRQYLTEISEKLQSFTAFHCHKRTATVKYNKNEIFLSNFTWFLSISTMNNFTFVYFDDFKLDFKISIFVSLNFNSNLLKLNIKVTYCL